MNSCVQHYRDRAALERRLARDEPACRARIREEAALIFDERAAKAESLSCRMESKS